MKIIRRIIGFILISPFIAAFFWLLTLSWIAVAIVIGVVAFAIGMHLLFDGLD